MFPVKARWLWSLALPEHYNWSAGDVVIRRGFLVAGQMNKSKLVQLVKHITLDRSAQTALDFMQNLNTVCGAYNAHVAPTTVTLEEVCPSPALARKCQDAVARAHARARRPGADVSACIADVTRQVGALVHLEQRNMRRQGIKHLVDSGSKGSPVNAYMMAGVLGKMLSAEEIQGVFTPPEDSPGGERRCFSTSARLDPFDGYVPEGLSRHVPAAVRRARPRRGGRR